MDALARLFFCTFAFAFAFDFAFPFAFYFIFLSPSLSQGQFVAALLSTTTAVRSARSLISDRVLTGKYCGQVILKSTGRPEADACFRIPDLQRPVAH
jgi:hypothetical protein